MLRLEELKTKKYGESLQNVDSSPSPFVLTATLRIRRPLLVFTEPKTIETLVHSFSSFPVTTNESQTKSYAENGHFYSTVKHFPSP